MDALAKLRAGVEAVRDRWVKSLPDAEGKRKVVCLLCGTEMPGEHNEKFNCGQLAALLTEAT